MPYKDPNDPRKKLAARRNSKKYYEKNRQAVIRRTKQSRVKSRKMWDTFKRRLSCVQCGQNHPATLDFHHVDRENYRSVNRLLSGGMYAAAMEEIQKCVVLCANCHRIHHYEERISKKVRSKKKKAVQSAVSTTTM